MRSLSLPISPSLSAPLFLSLPLSPSPSFYHLLLTSRHQCPGPASPADAGQGHARPGPQPERDQSGCDGWLWGGGQEELPNAAQATEGGTAEKGGWRSAPLPLSVPTPPAAPGLQPAGMENLTKVSCSTAHSSSRLLDPKQLGLRSFLNGPTVMSISQVF